MTGRRHETDVLVAGGGPVGSALGLELALHKVAFITADSGAVTPQAALDGPTDGPVRLQWRLDSFSSCPDRVEARIADLTNGDVVAVVARYLVVCDGLPALDTSYPPGAPPGIGSVVSEYRQGRVFRCGDAAHRLPASREQNREIGVADAGNLGWKLAAAVRGWGGDGLLDSYQEERQPVAEATAMGEVADPRLGHRYRSSVLVDDSADPEGVDESRPGLRAPHAWLSPGVSTQDLASEGFTLLHVTDRWSPQIDTPHPPGVPALRRAFADAGVPFAVTECRDTEIARRYRRPLVLVRPDGYVAWRGWRAPTDAAALVDLVRGAGMPTGQNGARLASA